VRRGRGGGEEGSEEEGSEEEARRWRGGCFLFVTSWFVSAEGAVRS
jgi:hypothetical protein